MERSHVIDALWPLLSAMDLGTGQLNEKAVTTLDKLTLEIIFSPHDIRDRSAALACLAGLRLLINDVDGAHKIAQDLSTPEGSFWHAIVHRRDGDFWNAKYWFRKVGVHPVYHDLGPTVQRFAAGEPQTPTWTREGSWDACGYVDWVERLSIDDTSSRQLCRQLQCAEWEALFAFCFRDAVATSN